MNRLKQVVKQVVSEALEVGGVHDRRLSAKYARTDRLLVLMYHRITNEPAQDPFRLGMCVQRKNFEAQLNLLADKFNVVSLTDAVDTLAKGGSLPVNSVAITFDDGYLDNLQLAAPMLKERGFPATFYIAIGGLETGQAFWWDRVIRATADTGLSKVDCQAIGISQSVSLSGLRRAGGVQTILNGLWALDPKDLDSAVDDVVARLNPHDTNPSATANGAPRMTEEQVRELSELGFDMGAHTIRHVDMRRLTSVEICAELANSRADLNSIVSAPIRSFAYPSGFHSPELQATVASQGFECAVSTDRGVNESPLRQHALYRVGAPDTSIVDFKRALSIVPIGSLQETVV